MAYVVEIAGPEALPDAVRIDDDASLLYAEASIHFATDAEHPFALAERARWQRSAERGRLWFARDSQGARVGFASLDVIDDAPYLDQLAVQRSAMRRGVGRRLLHEALAWAARTDSSALWLTTYAHLPWNRPYYEAHGFVVVPESECGPAIREHLAEQRHHLPFPEQRVAMRGSVQRMP